MTEKKDYKFTEEELEEITNIVSRKSIDQAQRRFGFGGDQWFCRICKSS